MANSNLNELALGAAFSIKKRSEPMLTTYTTNFNEQIIDEFQTKNSNKYGKYKSLKESGQLSMILPAQKVSNPVTSSNSLTYRTTQEDFGPRNPMSRTEYLKLHSPDAPMAVGRSGIRDERGVQSSGLLGEDLRVSDDPANNTFAQRSWQYADDPALKFKKTGIPEADFPADVSMDLSAHKSQVSFDGSQSFGRKGLVTGGSTSKCNLFLTETTSFR